MFISRYLGKVQETPTDWSFRFSIPEGYTYKAGQYSVIRIELTHPDTRSNARTCSFSSSPTENYLQFTYTIRDTGYKNTLMTMPEGLEVELTPARGKMILEEVNTRQCVMIAGGIGVTPFRGIVKRAYDEKVSDHDLLLLYSDKVIEELAFYSEFQDIESSYPNFQAVYTLTRHQPYHGSWLGNIGRIDALFISGYVSNTDDCTFMICGPVEMVKSTMTHLESLGVTRERMICELFTGY